MRMALDRGVLAVSLVVTISAAVRAHPGSGIAVDRRGHVYFLDTGSGLWKIDEQGKITKLPGPAFHWMALDEKDRFARARMPSGADWELAKSGSDPTALLSSDYPIAVGSDGNLYHAEPRRGNALWIVRRTPAGETSEVVRLPATPKGPIEYINGIAVGPDGALYYTEHGAIRKLTRQGQVSTVATVPAAADAPSIPGVTADLQPHLRGLAVDAKGIIYVAATGCGRVLKIEPGGKTTTIVQTESPWTPTAVAVAGGNVFVLEYFHTEGDDRSVWLPRVRRVTPDGKSTLIASVDRMPGARGGSEKR
jgi:sugar lactone lactonase YvrE